MWCLPACLPTVQEYGHASGLDMCKFACRAAIWTLSLITKVLVLWLQQLTFHPLQQHGSRHRTHDPHWLIR